jgi:hypothetical protein
LLWVHPGVCLQRCRRRLANGASGHEY